VRLFRRKIESDNSDTQRIEALSDGIFAIAITLLILEIHAPHLELSAPAHALRAALRDLWPAGFAYVFSFVTVGIYWANHHYVFKLYKRVNHAFILLNLFFLMCISFLPVPTEVLGDYLIDDNKRRIAVLFYNFALFLPAFAWSLSWIYASCRKGLLDPRLEPSFVATLTRQYILSDVLYLISIGLAAWNAWAGLALSVCLTFLYLLPPSAPRYRDDTSAGHAKSE